MRKMVLAALMTGVAFPIAFENEGSWKMDGDKLALDAKGNPIYLKSDGSEQSVDGGTISRLNGEAKQHRTAKETAEANLAKYRLADGSFIDPTKAVEAIDMVSKIDAKTLIDAGKVDEVRAEMSKQFTGQLDELKATGSKLSADNDALRLRLALNGSEFIKERIAVPAEMFEATFGRNFKVEDGPNGQRIVVPYDQSGNKIFSKKRMGDVADIDEALEIMVDGYAYKDTILKAPAAGGSGNGGGGGGRGGGRRMSRADFDALGPGDKAAAAGAVQKGELTVFD